MALRLAVLHLVSRGPLPTEDQDEELIREVQTLLERIAGPVTDEEAQALAGAFGPDDFFGLAWTLLHLIETAPSAGIASYTDQSSNPWIALLNRRVANGHRLRQE